MIINKLDEDWLAPKNLSDNEYMKLIKERRPGYSFDRINKGKNRSQVLFRTLDRIIKQDEERKARKLDKEKSSELTHKPVINNPKYNFEDDNMPNFYKTESYRGNKMRFKKLNESYVDGDYVYLEYPNLHVEISYVPSKYKGAHSDVEDDFALYGKTYEDNIEYTYKVDKNSIIEKIYDYLDDEAINNSIPQRDYILRVIDNLDISKYPSDDYDYYEDLLDDYIDTNLNKLINIFEDSLLAYFEDYAAEEAAENIDPNVP